MKQRFLCIVIILVMTLGGCGSGSDSIPAEEGEPGTYNAASETKNDSYSETEVYEIEDMRPTELENVSSPQLEPAVDEDPQIAQALQDYTSGASVIDNGKCPYGDDVSWTFYDNGTLVFSGQGDIGDIPPGTPHWYVHTDDTKNVIVSTGITRLGRSALSYFDEIDTITLPNTLTSIGPYSICIDNGGNGTWDTLILPDSVVTIEESAFRGCSALHNITIPSSVITIGDGAFANCFHLEEITIPGSISVINERMFSSCANLKKVTLEEGVTAIREWAFNGCGLRELHLPASLTTVEAHAFCASIPLPAAPGSAIEAVYYNGTQEQWNAVNVDNTDSTPNDSQTSDDNNELLNATFYFNAP